MRPKNETKLNTLIYKSFLNTLDVIPQELQIYATKARLVDMMDFEKVEFNKAISLNPKTQREEIKSQYPLVKLKICGDFFMGGTPSRKNINYWNGDIKWLTISDYSNRQVIMDTKEKITREGFKNSNAKMIQKGAVVVSIYATIGRVGILGEDMTTNQAIVAIIPNEEFINKYLMYAIDYFKFQLYNEVITTSQQNINLGILQNMVIPKPPLEIQKQIVAECEKVEEQYNTLSLSIKEYQNLIKAMLQKCGIIEDNQEYELNSILENLQKLESKLDFNLLLSLIEEQISHSEVLVEETQSKERRQDFNAFKNFSKTIKELLQTLPASPQNGWERVKLKDICNINQETYNPSNDLGEMLYIDIDSVEKETGKINFNDKIPCKNLPTRARRIARADSVIISTVRPYLKGFVYIKDEIKDSIFSTGFAILNGKENIAKSQFVYYCFMFVDDLMRQIEIKMPKSSYPSINTDDIGSFIIPLPPLEIQEKIVQNIELVEQQIDFLNLKLEFLEKEKEKILQKYLFS